MFSRQNHIVMTAKSKIQTTPYDRNHQVSTKPQKEQPEWKIPQSTAD